MRASKRRSASPRSAVERCKLVDRQLDVGADREASAAPATPAARSAPPAGSRRADRRPRLRRAHRCARSAPHRAGARPLRGAASTISRRARRCEVDDLEVQLLGEHLDERALAEQAELDEDVAQALARARLGESAVVELVFGDETAADEELAERRPAVARAVRLRLLGCRLASAGVSGSGCREAFRRWPWPKSSRASACRGRVRRMPAARSPLDARLARSRHGPYRLPAPRSGALVGARLGGRFRPDAESPDCGGSVA